MPGHTTLPDNGVRRDAAADAIGLDPVSRTSLTESVVERVEHWIVSSRQPAGARLPSERELARRFAVSRIVVREALGRLEARGLIEVRAGVGTFVAEAKAASAAASLSLFLSRSEVGLEHLFDVRLALEPAMAAAAARSADEEAIAAMFATVDLTDGIVRDLSREPDAVESYAWADLEFHQLLAQASDNPLYDVLLAPLIDRLLDVRRSGALLPGAARRANAGHRKVLDAVAAHEPGRAAEAMRGHLLYVKELLDAAQRAAEEQREQEHHGTNLVEPTTEADQEENA